MAERNGKTRRLESAGKPDQVYLATLARRVEWKRLSIVLLGVAFFSAVYLSPAWPDAVDPSGRHFPLSGEGKAALALFLLALTWWVGEVVPIGVTGIAIGVFQTLFLVRPGAEAFRDFMDPSIWFIVGSLVTGMVFTKTGLTQRMAYRMLLVVGESTRVLYFGCFAMTGIMALLMSHTAVAATIFPLLMAVYSLYEEDDRPTRFGKGLFIGMAFAAGAGSIVTLLGAARGPFAIGLYERMTGRGISFLEISYFMLPLGWGILLLLWIFCMVLFPPEKRTIPGLRQRAQALHARLGPMSRNERFAVLIAVAAIAALILQSFVPFMRGFDKSAVLLVSSLLFFLLRILELKDLEEIPWNIVLFFGGAVSLGFCLWQTGFSAWLAVRSLVVFERGPWGVFVIGVALLVMVMGNVVMNAVAIALCLPVALLTAPYLGVAPPVILYAILAAAGMPFMLLIGSAPNAIAHSSRQFTAGDFFAAGLPASFLVLIALGLFVWVVWPLMGMAVLTP